MKDKEKTIDGLKVRNVVKNTTSKKVSARKEKKHQKPVEEKVEVDEKSEEAREDFLEPTKAFDLDISSDEIKEEVKQEKKELKKKEKKPRKKIIKIIEWVALVLVLLVIGGIIWVLVWGNDLIVKLTGGRSDIWGALNAITSETYEPLKVDSKGRTNILLFGTSGYDMSGSEGKGTHAGAQLTDSIMIISVDQETSDIAMVSLPRDLKAGSTCTATGKINEVYWCANQKGNNEDAGAKALEERVGSILGLDFQYYIHVNWGSLQKVVDTIGGITVTLDEDINDRSYTGVKIKAGVPTNLTGIQAVALARARHGTAGGDFSRGNSQQKILIAIKDKVLANGIKFTDALNLVNIIGDNIRTDLEAENLKTGLHLVQDVDLSTMRQVSLLDYDRNAVYMTTANINGISYVVPKAGVGNYNEIQKYIAKMFNSDPVVREEAKILVLNGSGQAGVATALKNDLEAKKYKVLKAGDAPEGEYTDRYYIYDVSDEKTDVSGTLRRLAEEDLGGVVKSAKELPAGISTKGYDIVIIIGGKKKAE